jgi:hypothetical protein
MEPEREKRRSKKRAKKLRSSVDLPPIPISSQDSFNFAIHIDFAFWLSDPRTYSIVLVFYFVIQKLILPLHSHPMFSGFRFANLDPQNPLVRYMTVFRPSSPPLPSALLIYTTCHNSAQFSIWRSEIPSVGLECNNDTRLDDCNEAVPYLNFIIDRYDDRLADKYIFAHGHDTAWHYQGDFFDALGNLLRSTYFRKMKYSGVFRGNYYTGPWSNGEESWARPLYKYVFGGTSMPRDPAVTGNQRPCCATFWLNVELIRNRKKEEYMHMRDRLRQWSSENRDAHPSPAWFCGRTMEYTWHIIFTKSAFVDACHLCQGDN